MKKLTIGLVILASLIFIQTISANHYLGVKWNKPTPMTITVYDATVNPSYRRDVALAAADWSASSVVDYVVVPSSDGCKKHSNAVTVCEATLGSFTEGPYGLATIYLKGQAQIAAVVIKLTDDAETNRIWDGNYNISGGVLQQRRHVVCQELGHALGLDHQLYPADSCMDSGQPDVYTPNAHDYEELGVIYP